jgi:hypothetical protein
MNTLDFVMLSSSSKINALKRKNRKLQGVLDGAIELLKHFSESGYTEYNAGDDDPGACTHCHKVSYKDHEKDCPIIKARAFLEKVNKMERT